MTTVDWSPFVCAHRGASETYPENTLIAFEKAAEVGAGWIETDIQLLADNTLAVSMISFWVELQRAHHALLT